MRKTSIENGETTDQKNNADKYRIESRLSNMNPVGSTSTLREKSIAKSNSSQKDEEIVGPIVAVRSKFGNKKANGEKKLEAINYQGVFNQNNQPNSNYYKPGPKNIKRVKPVGRVPPLDQKSFLNLVTKQQHQFMFQAPPFLTSPNTPTGLQLLSS